MYKVNYIEVKKDKNGNDMKVVTFNGLNKKVYVNSRYETDVYDKVVEGAEFEIVDDGNFKKIKSDKPQTSRQSNIAKAVEKKNEFIEKAQVNRSGNVKVASTMRDAVLLALEAHKDPSRLNTLEEEVLYWRGWLWEHYDDPVNNPIYPE